MNTFDYWFDYIVRNGEFLFVTKQTRFQIDCYEWQIKIDQTRYKACFMRHYNIEKEETSVEKCISVLYRDPLYTDSTLTSFFYRDRFNLNHARLKSLVKRV